MATYDQTMKMACDKAYHATDEKDNLDLQGFAKEDFLFIHELDAIVASRTNKWTKGVNGLTSLTCGCMFGGKSNSLAQQLITLAVAERRVLFLNFPKDARFSLAQGIKTHHGYLMGTNSHQNLRMYDIEPTTISQFVAGEIPLPIRGMDVIGMDELHFYKRRKEDERPGNIESDLIKLTFHVVDLWNIQFYVGGINFWANGTPVRQIECIRLTNPEIVTYINAICERCNCEKATRNVIRKDFDALSNPEKMDANDLVVKEAKVMVGARDVYLPLCRSCHVKANLNAINNLAPEDGTDQLFKILYPIVTDHLKEPNV